MSEIQVEGHAPFPANADATLLELCEDAGLPIEAACGGFACCNTCRVQVVDGAQNLSPMLPEEEPFLDAEDQRLACQVRVLGPVSLRLAPGA